MDKTAIKNFAITARKNLKTAITQKAYDIGIFEDRSVPVYEVQGGFIYNEQSYSKEELAGRKKLIDKINLLADGNGYKHGYAQVIEEVAYTWFNRLIALRFMELNGFLPSNIRIVSSTNPDRVEPDCIREVESLNFVNMQTVAALSNDTEKLYRYILIAQCNALADIMPRMFEKIADYTELLLPDRLYLREGNIVYDLVHSISEADFKEQVEIIGWLYQFYISEKKDEVFAGLKKNIKITKENIPAATQLFTPDWIVKYMVENSLGRLAVEKLDIDPIEMNWKYYIEEAEQTNEVKQQLSIINANKKDFDIKNVKVVDPCMGSGHILVYAFDVLYQIYEKLGYTAREIPNLILENNLFGLDIDARAGQLAYFALMMKARSYNRRFFRQTTVPQPQVYVLTRDSEIAIYKLSMDDFMLDKTFGTTHQESLNYLIKVFQNIDEYGSLIKLENRHYVGLLQAWNNYADATASNFNLTLWFAAMEKAIPDIVKKAIVLSQKYDVVITNPPYMGGSGMGAKLSEYVKKNYPDSKSDLFAVFIEKCGEMLKPNGYQAMITQHAWMFLSSYVKLRTKLLLKDIVNMAHLGARAFEEIGGEVVQTTAFVLRNSNVVDYKATFARLVDYSSQKEKETAFLNGSGRYITKKENMKIIPSSRFAFWISRSQIFESTLIENFFVSAGRNKTHNNERFVRIWWECDINKKHWLPYANGGNTRKWYGNKTNVVDWSNFAKVEYAKHGGLLPQKSCECIGITWNGVSGNKNAFRIKEAGTSLSSSSPTIISENYTIILQTLGFLNSKPSDYLLNALNPTLQLNVGEVLELPLKNSDFPENLIKLVEQNITISKTDWDSFETSWDFKRHPLI